MRAFGTQRVLACMAFPLDNDDVPAANDSDDDDDDDDDDDAPIAHNSSDRWCQLLLALSFLSLVSFC